MSSPKRKFFQKNIIDNYSHFQWVMPSSLPWLLLSYIELWTGKIRRFRVFCSSFQIIIFRCWIRLAFLYRYQVYFYLLSCLAFRFSVSVWRCGRRSLRPSGGRSVAGRVVARRFGCAGRRESVARALRSASGGGGRWSGWIGAGRACLRLVSTFWCQLSGCNSLKIKNLRGLLRGRKVH